MSFICYIIFVIFVILIPNVILHTNIFLSSNSSGNFFRLSSVYIISSISSLDSRKSSFKS